MIIDRVFQQRIASSDEPVWALHSDVRAQLSDGLETVELELHPASLMDRLQVEGFLLTGMPISIRAGSPPLPPSWSPVPAGCFVFDVVVDGDQPPRFVYDQLITTDHHVRVEASNPALAAVLASLLQHVGARITFNFSVVLNGDRVWLPNQPDQQFPVLLVPILNWLGWSQPKTADYRRLYYRTSEASTLI